MLSRFCLFSDKKCSNNIIKYYNIPLCKSYSSNVISILINYVGFIPIKIFYLDNLYALYFNTICSCFLEISTYLSKLTEQRM